MEVDLDFPYRAEYAKSGRASCRSCKGNIGKDSLRLAVIIQSPSFDGKITHWYHFMCFFTKQKPKSVDDIAHFNELRWEDQQKIKEKIENSTSNGNASGSRKSSSKKSNNDFSVEYAKSGRATCNGECEEKILKGEIRISKKDYDSESAKRYGPMPRWRHVDCFVKDRSELEYFDSAENLPGFNTLSAEDKKMLRGKIPKMECKRKAEDIPDGPSKKVKSENDEVLRKQNKWLYYYRDQLEKNLNKSGLSDLLTYNNYPALSGESYMLDVLSDLMTFGVIPKCEVCNEGKYIFKSGIGYMCNGDVSEWTKCRNVLDKPKRSPFKVPDVYANEIQFLEKYKYKSRGDRIFTKRATEQPKKSNGSENGKSGKPLKPLTGLTFVVLLDKVNKESKKEIENRVQKMGGSISSKITSETAAVITSTEFLSGKNKKLSQAELHKIECVPVDFLDEVEIGGVELMIKKKNMATWTQNTEKRLASLKEKNSSKMKSGSKSSSGAKSVSMTVTLKDGTFVDPKSGLSDNCHVYKKGNKPYSVVLGLVDLASGLNSYYKLQILESDDKKSWYLFRAWGRIGTDIGDSKVEDMDDPNDAIFAFNEVYEKKTGNKFLASEQEKLPGFWFPLEMDHGESKGKALLPDLKTSKSKLPKSVQELVSLIFDVDSMKQTMIEYELDLKKMPLGKLSSRQLEQAYLVLSEALNLLDNNKPETVGEVVLPATTTPAPNKTLLLDCSNRFYTLIPHDFGLNSPPLLDNEELIKSKIEMIDSLREIEIAYNLIKTDSDSESVLDPIDECYKKLKTDIQIVEKDSKEFDLVNKFVSNTHAPTHTSYGLKIEEVFKVDREGEKKRFKPFKKLHNHQLLWHGSRLTNFVGILSKGLRIAPPEAPATGYMFGKGIYFADMVSKSANYCCTSKNYPTGLLLLCQVALGDMHELKNAKNITKLPSGKHSVKGLGATCPDPLKTVKLSDGTTVPIGTPTNADVKSSSLLYNEYIVYDIGQVNIKYLVKTTFDYKF